MAAFIELPEAKQFLNMTSSADDTELTRFIAAACRMCERYRDEIIGIETVTDSFHLDDIATGLNLSRGPIAALVSVENDTRQWDPTDLRIRSRIRRVVAPTEDPFEGYVEVTYTVGHNPVPEDWKHAGLVLLKHLWDTQRRASMGAFNRDSEDAFDPSMAYSLPNRVKEALGEQLPGVA